MIRCGPGRFGFQSSHCYFDWCLILSPCFGDQSVRLLSGIAAILDAIQPPGKFGPVLQQNQLDDSAVKLKEQEYDLLIAEMEYDIKSFRVWKRKIQDHDMFGKLSSMHPVFHVFSQVTQHVKNNAMCCSPTPKFFRPGRPAHLNRGHHRIHFSFALSVSLMIPSTKFIMKYIIIILLSQSFFGLSLGLHVKKEFHSCFGSCIALHHPFIFQTQESEVSQF